MNGQKPRKGAMLDTIASELVQARITTNEHWASKKWYNPANGVDIKKVIDVGQDTTSTTVQLVERTIKCISGNPLVLIVYEKAMQLYDILNQTRAQGKYRRNGDEKIPVLVIQGLQRKEVSEIMSISKKYRCQCAVVSFGEGAQKQTEASVAEFLKVYYRMRSCRFADKIGRAHV